MKQAPLIYGVMAEFDSPEMLCAGAERAHAAGYRRMAEAIAPALQRVLR